jgi:hypothetical protein
MEPGGSTVSIMIESKDQGLDSFRDSMTSGSTERGIARLAMQLDNRYLRGGTD